MTAQQTTSSKQRARTRAPAAELQPQQTQELGLLTVCSALSEPHGELFRRSLLSKAQKPAPISHPKSRGSATRGTTVGVKLSSRAQAARRTPTKPGRSFWWARSGHLLRLGQSPSYQQQRGGSLHAFHKRQNHHAFSQMFSVPTCDSTHTAL